MNNFYSLFLKSGNFQVEIYPKGGLTANYEIPLPTTAPVNNSVMRYNSTTATFEWVDASAFGSGSVTSVALTAPSAQFNVTGSPITNAGTLALSWKAVSGNVVFASPSNGSSLEPAFRSLVDADLPSSISASKINGVLTKANIPSGTNATSFQLNNASGAILSNDAGTGFYVYTSDGSTLGDLRCRKLFVTESIDTVSSTTVNLGDAVLRLLSDVTTGTPSTDAGISVRRGASTNAAITWQESTDTWSLGLEGSLLPIARRIEKSIVNADLSAGTYVWTHNLGKFPVVSVVDNTGAIIGVPITHTNGNVLSISFSRVGTLTGTWILVAVG